MFHNTAGWDFIKHCDFFSSFSSMRQYASLVCLDGKRVQVIQKQQQSLTWMSSEGVVLSLGFRNWFGMLEQDRCSETQFLTHIQIQFYCAGFGRLFRRVTLLLLIIWFLLIQFFSLLFFNLEIDRWSHSFLNCNAIIYWFIFNWQMLLSWHSIESSCITCESNPWPRIDHHQQLNFILSFSNSS